MKFYLEFLARSNSSESSAEHSTMLRGNPWRETQACVTLITVLNFSNFMEFR